MATETVVLDRHGRIIIPSHVRRQMGWEAGEKLMLTVGQGEVNVLSRRQALDRIQQEIRKHVRPGARIVDELIRERREEAQRDEADFRKLNASRGPRARLAAKSG